MNSFTEAIKKMQYDTSLELTSVVSSASKEKLYLELRLEFHQWTRLYRKLDYFFRIFKSQYPNYLFNAIAKSKRNFQTINCDIIL